MASEDSPGALEYHEESGRARILTVEDVAALLRVPRSWVYEHSRARGKRRIPHKKLGKYLRFIEQEVHAWFVNLPGC